jgi:hypothetical protein
MAAIICGSISNFIESVYTLPCCTPLCESAKKFTKSSFCLYKLVALWFNIPPVVFALTVITNPFCRGSQWLVPNSAFCVTHIVAAFYISKKSKSWDETVQTICYDMWVAGYILLSIVSVVWLSIGALWNSQGAMANGNCPANIASLTANSCYCGFAFVSCGSSALLISLLVSWCKGDTEKKRSLNHPPSNDSVLFPCLLLTWLYSGETTRETTGETASSSVKGAETYTPPSKETPPSNSYCMC